MDRRYFKQNVSPKTTFHGTVAQVMSIIENTVGATYGPFGTHNIFKIKNEINASKDGYENLNMIRFDDATAEAVYQMVFEVAGHQAHHVGDGTTTAILVTAAVYHELRNNKELFAKYTPSQIQDAASTIIGALVNDLENGATALTAADVFDLAFTSVDGNSELADVLVELYNGNNDLANENVLLDISMGSNTYIQSTSGLNISGQLMHSAFANQDGVNASFLRNAEILVIDGKVNIENSLYEYARKLKAADKSLVIFCSGVNQNAVRFIEALNQSQPEIFLNMAIVYTRANSIQDSDDYNDLVKVTGAAGYEENTTIDANNIAGLAKGYANTVIIRDRKITLSGFKQSDSLDRHVSWLQEKINEIVTSVASGLLPQEDVTRAGVELNALKKRLQVITNGVRTIYVGGDSVQRKSINLRLVEDGLKAVQSALRSGYGVGCNVDTLASLFSLMAQTKDGFTGKPQEQQISVFSLLLDSLMEAYLKVYYRLVQNRTAISRTEFMDLIVTNAGKKLVDENGRIDMSRYTVPVPVFAGPINLRGDSTNRVINPIQTDINIVERAIDTAIVLATANTIFVDAVDFEGEV
jgi:chaperonin GroEL (HSP60 family)